MDIKRYGEKIPVLLKKYKYALLVLAVGIVFMVWPEKNQGSVSVESVPSVSTNKQDVAQELAEILEKIQGVGKVQVLLTVKAGESTVYQTDVDTTVSDSTSTVRKETVFVTDAQRNQQALIVQILPPEYMGAIVVCQGADNASVRLAVVEAVCKATGLRADRVSVLTMKG